MPHTHTQSTSKTLSLRLALCKYSLWPSNLHAHTHTRTHTHTHTHTLSAYCQNLHLLLLTSYHPLFNLFPFFPWANVINLFSLKLTIGPNKLECLSFSSLVSLFANEAGAYPSGAPPGQALLSNIRQGWKSRPWTNTLAYLSHL